jgi:hypothetical protein
MHQLTSLAFIHPNRRWVVKELEKLLAEWEAWSKEVDQIVDQRYDRNAQSEVFANGESFMQKHEILQSKTLTFLNSNISGHGFIAGFDGRHCDRTDLRLKHRVKHRIQELRVLRACLDALQGQEKVTDIEFSSPNAEKIWQDIRNDYGINKRAFGKKINFVTDAFKRAVLFRDIGQAYLLANAGFSKPAAILAGSVIEELLRLFLKHEGITPTTNNFDGYIKACRDKDLLKSAIHGLTESVRHFRNLVHLEKEVSARHTISKSTAKGAVASIFTIANDFGRRLTHGAKSK